MQPGGHCTFTHIVQSTLYSSQVGNTIGALLANHVLDWGIRNELEPIWLVGLADTLNLSKGVKYCINLGIVVFYLYDWSDILTNKAKQLSEFDGRRFLQDSFAVEQEVLKVKLALSAKSITHDATMGAVTESHFITVLRRYLPQRYKIDTGIAIDSNGKTSHQIDIIVYDNQYTPVLLDQKAHRFIPAEAIYAVFESKPTINKENLEYAAEKAASVRALERTSVQITHAGGTFDAKPLFPIIAGIVASDIDWVDGFGKSFENIYPKLVGNQKLDCGLAVSGHCFDTFEADGSITFGPTNQALIYFLFRLLQKLQSLGTVPAIDWNAYANVLSE